MVSLLARLLIAWRKPLGVLFLAVTLGLGVSALNTRLDPGFNKLIPLKHDYMSAFLKYASTFSGANRVLVSVHWKGEGDIYNAEFLEVLRKVTDEVFYIPGVNRAGVRSLFTPNTRYIEVTEEGFTGDVVIPARFSANPDELAQVRTNVAKAGEIGRLVANDLKSALVQADLLEVNPQTGKKLDYAEVARRLEKIRGEFSSPHIDIQIVGFAKVMGDVMEGLLTVVFFFAIAFVITALLLWWYSRSFKLTVLAITVATMPVIWLLGLLPLIGYGIDPMSVLVPFLIFSIGVSHAVQMTNAWKQDVLGGASALQAAESAFRKLAVPGTMALLANALGFLVIMLIDIPIVHELGITASAGPRRDSGRDALRPGDGARAGRLPGRHHDGVPRRARAARGQHRAGAPGRGRGRGALDGGHRRRSQGGPRPRADPRAAWGGVGGGQGSRAHVQLRDHAPQRDGRGGAAVRVRLEVPLRGRRDSRLLL